MVQASEVAVIIVLNFYLPRGTAVRSQNANLRPQYSSELCFRRSNVRIGTGRLWLAFLLFTLIGKLPYASLGLADGPVMLENPMS